MHKKSILALALIMAPLFAQAAATQGQLTFTWQGTIPAVDVVSTSWSFTDAAGNDYTPIPIVLQATIADDNTLDLVTQAPATFEIRSATSANNLSSISAYLASPPVSTGLIKQLTLKETLAAPNAGEVVVVLNNNALKTGSSNAVAIQNNINNAAAAMSLALYAKVEQDGYTPGSSVSFSTPIIFSVDVTARNG